VVLVLTGLPVFFESTSLINEGDPKNREHWVQIISTIPEISSIDHNRNQTTDKRIIYSRKSYFWSSETFCHEVKSVKLTNIKFEL